MAKAGTWVLVSGVLLVACGLCGVAAGAGPDGEVLPRMERRLFIDDGFVVERHGFQLVACPPTRRDAGTIAVAGGAVDAVRGGAVTYRADRGFFQLWCVGSGRASAEDDGAGPIVYATSRDGLEWRVPPKARVRVDGLGDKRVVDIAVCFRADGDAAGEPYKALIRAGADGDAVDVVYAASSANGRRWHVVADKAVGRCHGSASLSLVWDGERGRYVAFGAFAEGGGIARIDSADLRSWSAPRALKSAAADMTVCRVDGVYMGFSRPGVVLASDDGVAWQGCPVKSGFGPADVPIGAVVTDDELWLYSGREDADRGVVGLTAAMWDRGRIVGLAASSDEAMLVTKPFVYPGEGALRMNVDAAGGDVRAAVVDEMGTIVPESHPVRVDEADALFHFDAEPIRGGPTVRLRVRARNATVYSLRVE